MNHPDSPPPVEVARPVDAVSLKLSARRALLGQGVDDDPNFPAEAGPVTCSDTHSMSKFLSKSMTARPRASRTRPPAAAAAGQFLLFSHDRTTVCTTNEPRTTPADKSLRSHQTSVPHACNPKPTTPRGLRGLRSMRPTSPNAYENRGGVAVLPHYHAAKRH